jgi:hypothetical protein
MTLPLPSPRYLMAHPVQPRLFAWPRDLVIAGDLIGVANQTDDPVAVFDRTALPATPGVFEVASPSPACIVLPDDDGKAVA